MELFDIGANLAHASFRADLDRVLDRAVGAGVGTIVVTGTGVESNEHALRLARAHPGRLYCTAGVHPHEAGRCDDETLPTLRRQVAHRQVVAVGECGLDFNRDFSPRPLQEKWFAAQVELACELGKPLFMHERDAHARFVDILGTFSAQLPPAVVHCFTGTADELDAYLALGCYIGITGWICDDRRGQPLRDIVGRIPPQRLMIETDAPYLTPRDVPGLKGSKRNEPANLVHVLRTLARCLQRDEAQVAQETTAAARRFFRLAQEPGDPFKAC